MIKTCRFFVMVFLILLPVIVCGAEPIILVQPNGGTIPSGSSYQIQWTGDAHHYTLKLSMDNGMTWSTIASNITGNSHNWTVPTPANNKRKCLIRVIGYNASNVKVGADRSDGPFTIEVVKINTPNGGGEPLPSGSSYDITWRMNETRRLVARVVISNTLNGGTTWSRIATLTEGEYLEAGEHTYTWTVPTVTSTRTRCRVRVVLKDSAGNTIGSDVSDMWFTIAPASEGMVSIIGGSNQ